jgi:hypothetical protein
MRAALLAVTLLLAGCHRLTFQLVDAPSTHVVTERNAFWMLGLFPRRHGDALGHCPHGVATIVEETTFADGALALATLGVYTPRTSHYHCLAGVEDAR